MLQIVIFDDIPVQADAIKSAVALYIQEPCQMTLFSEAPAFKAYLADSGNAIDILLMDIDLGSPQEDGIALAKLVHTQRKNCQIIFVSAYTHYISAVYDAEHIFFVTKTDIGYWLPKALEKAVARLSTATGQKLRFTYNRKSMVISTEDILFFERQVRKTTIQTRQEQYIIAERLENLPVTLPSPPFIRCHRSYLINLDYVVQHQKTEFHITSGHVIPISRSFAAEAKAAFHRYISGKI